MKITKSLILLASLALILLLSFSCGPSAPPETRAGEWEASTDFGEFTFIVDPTGTKITSLDYGYQSCSSAILSGGVTFSSTINIEGGLPIEGNKFTLETGGISSMEFKGSFSKDGTSASGSWKAGDCSGKWKVTRSQPNSPDNISGRIAFVSGIDIYVINADGSERTRLTDDDAYNRHPAWSPDGSRIAFDSKRGPDSYIYVINSDGSGLTRLTDDSSDDSFPVWSPDGTQIAYASYRDGWYYIYVMNTDGSEQIELTDNAAMDTNPVWSPDGSKIAFFGVEIDGEFPLWRHIYVVNANGSGLTRLTDDNANDYCPLWSPDGTRIVYMSGRDGNGEIYVMNADGSGLTRLTDDSASDFLPVWSPDGKQIAFVSERDGNWEIYVMNADGSGQTNLTNKPSTDCKHGWSP